MRKLISWVIFITLSLLLNVSCGNVTKDNLIFVCDKNNDLYTAIVEAGGKYQRFTSTVEAVDKAAPGSGLLVLADHYPDQKVVPGKDFFRMVKDKNLNIYLEFPDTLPGLKTGEIQKIDWERGVVTSGVFGESLKKHRIVMIHDCHYVQVDDPDPYMVMAKVAGFDTAVYGLDSTDTHPILFEFPDAKILVSTTKLSQFVTGRYAPKDAWAPIWGFIFNWLQPEDNPPGLNWTETVRPAYYKNEKISRKQRLQAAHRGVDWYYKSMLPSSGNTDYKQNKGAGQGDGLDQFAYGKSGIYECFLSSINYKGSQPIGKNTRADCASEAAMAIALRSFRADNQSDKTTAGNLQDWIYRNSSLKQGPRARPESPSFGFIDWFTHRDDNEGVYYSDDNARVILGTITTSAALNSDRWDEGVLKAILANFRTTGPAGFKPRRLEEPDLQNLGWEYYRNDEYYHYAPHFQSWIWATYLWLYDKTKYEPLIQLSETGIKNMMKAYPDEWHWTNGLQQERARMILPLAWLLRVDDTPEHRKWLFRITDDLLSFQDESGAIREDLGDVGHGKYAPPKSNAAYGTNEAPLIQENGDPVADMLYTSNFAFFSLTEAAAATGDERLKDAVQKLADFMVRIQVRSEAHPELDGAWYRAFDFDRWEYWASNADAGWGAWSTETGWTQGWISTMLMFNELNTNLWDFTAASKIADQFDEVARHMLPAKFNTQKTPDRPVINKLGTIDCDLVETTPVVFKNRVYRYEYVRKGYKANLSGDSYSRFIDHESGESTAAFAEGYHLGSAFVDRDSVYVTAVDIWDGEHILMFVSADLKHWQSRPLLHLPGFGIFNTSLCKADNRYVLMYEIGKPPEEAGKRFTARFASSVDLVNWKTMPKDCTYSKDRYTAPHALRYLDGYFYNFYLEAFEGYEMRVVRSTDLINWEASPFNPVLKASEEDKKIANSLLTSAQRKAIAEAKNINNSDIDFCEYNGKLIINYSWGNQQGEEFLAEAVFDGSLEAFLKGLFQK
jgi:hypothetical protein